MRWIVVIGIELLYFIYLVNPYRTFCINFDEQINPWIFTFLMSDLLIHMNLTFGGLALLSDAFNNNNFIEKEKSKGAAKGIFQNFGLILMCTLIYTIVLYILSLLVFLPFVKFGTTWGTVISTFGKTQNYSSPYIPVFEITRGIVETYHPIFANFISLLLFWLYLVFLICFMNMLNLLVNSKYAGGMIALYIALFDISINNDLPTKLYWYSPGSLSRLGLLHIMPPIGLSPIVYAFEVLVGGIIIVFLMLLLMLQVLGYRKSKKKKG